MESLYKFKKIIDERNVDSDCFIYREQYLNSVKTGDVEKINKSIKEYLSKMEQRGFENQIDLLLIHYKVVLNNSVSQPIVESHIKNGASDLTNFIKLFTDSDEEYEKMKRLILIEELERMIFEELGKQYVNEIIDSYRLHCEDSSNQISSVDKVNKFKLDYMVFMISFIDDSSIDCKLDYKSKSEILRKSIQQSDFSLEEFKTSISNLGFLWDLSSHISNADSLDIDNAIVLNSTEQILKSLDVIDYILKTVTDVEFSMFDSGFHIGHRERYSSFLKGLYEFSKSYYRSKKMFDGYPISLEMDVTDLIDEFMCIVGFEQGSLTSLGRIFNHTKFKDLRKRRGMTVEEIANQCKTLDKNSLNNIIYGKSNRIRVGNIIELSLTLHAKPSEFIELIAEIPFYSKYILSEIDEMLLNFNPHETNNLPPKKMIQIRELFQQSLVIGLSGELIPAPIKEELAEVLEKMLTFIEKEESGFEEYLPVMKSLEKIKSNYRTLNNLKNSNEKEGNKYGK